MSNVLKNLLIALAITLVLVVVYYLFIRDRVGDETVSVPPQGTAASAAIEIERIFADTQRINSYRIDEHDDILTDPRFTSLVDRRVEIREVPTGRNNPFAPVQ